MIPMPKTLALLATRDDLSDGRKAAIEKVLKGADLETSLRELGRYWKVKVWFNTPVDVYVLPHIVKRAEEDGYVRRYRENSKKVDVHIFQKITVTQFDHLLYCTTRRGRRGYYFPSLEKLIRYEPVIQDEAADEFSSYEEFKAKFDPTLIRESEIQNLWAHKSGQHGKQYLKSDFRRLGPVGLRVLERFLPRFSLDATPMTPGYMSSNGSYYLHEYFTSNGRQSSRFGRDIKIEHGIHNDKANGYVHYSSEYPGCGNGRYGLLANKKEFLHLEDD